MHASPTIYLKPNLCQNWNHWITFKIIALSYLLLWWSQLKWTSKIHTLICFFWRNQRLYTTHLKHLAFTVPLERMRKKEKERGGGGRKKERKREKKKERKEQKERRERERQRDRVDVHVLSLHPNQKLYTKCTCVWAKMWIELWITKSYTGIILNGLSTMDKIKVIYYGSWRQQSQHQYIYCKSLNKSRGRLFP